MKIKTKRTCNFSFRSLLNFKSFFFQDAYGLFGLSPVENDFFSFHMAAGAAAGLQFGSKVFDHLRVMFDVRDNGCGISRFRISSFPYFEFHAMIRLWIDTIVISIGFKYRGLQRGTRIFVKRCDHTTLQPHNWMSGGD